MLVPQTDFSQWRNNCGEFNVSSISVLGKIFPPPIPQKYRDTTNNNNNINNGIIENEINNGLNPHQSSTANENPHRPTSPVPQVQQRPETPKVMTKSSSRSKDINNLLDESVVVDINNSKNNNNNDSFYDDDDDDYEDDNLDELSYASSASNKFRHRVLVRQGEHCFVAVLPVRGETGKKSSIIAWNRDASVITRCGHEEAYEQQNANLNGGNNNNNNSTSSSSPLSPNAAAAFLPPQEPERIRWLSSVETIGRYSSVFATCTKSTIIVWLVGSLTIPPSMFNSLNSSSSGGKEQFPKVLPEYAQPILICKAPEKTKKIWSPCLYLQDTPSGNPSSVLSVGGYHHHHPHQQHSHHHHQQHQHHMHHQLHHHSHHHYQYSHHHNQQQQQNFYSGSHQYYGMYQHHHHYPQQQSSSYHHHHHVASYQQNSYQHQQQQQVKFISTSIDVLFFADTFDERRQVCRCGVTVSISSLDDSCVVLGERPVEILQGEKLIIRGRQDLEREKMMLQQQQQQKQQNSDGNVSGGEENNNNSNTTAKNTENVNKASAVNPFPSSSSASQLLALPQVPSQNSTCVSTTTTAPTPSNNNINNAAAIGTNTSSSRQQQQPVYIETGFGNGGNLLPEKDSVFGNAPTKNHHPPALMAAMAPLFAFTVADDAVVTSPPDSCSTTPSWVPCEDCPGEPLVSIAWLHTSGNSAGRDRIFDGSFRSAKQSSYRLVCSNSRRIVISKVGLGGQPEKIQRIVCNGVNPATGTGLLFRSVFCTFDSRIWVEYVYHNISKKNTSSSTPTIENTTTSGSEQQQQQQKPKISQHLELACIELPNDESLASPPPTTNAHQQLLQKYSLTSKISTNAVKLGLKISSKPLRLNNVHLSCCLYQNRFLGKFSSLISPQVFLYDPVRRRLCLTTSFSCLEKMNDVNVAVIVPRHMRFGNESIAANTSSSSPTPASSNNNKKSTPPEQKNIPGTSNFNKFGTRPLPSAAAAANKTTPSSSSSPTAPATGGAPAGKVWKFGVAPSSFGATTTTTSSKNVTPAATTSSSNKNTVDTPKSSTSTSTPSGPRVWKFGKSAPPAIASNASNSSKPTSLTTSPQNLSALLINTNNSQNENKKSATQNEEASALVEKNKTNNNTATVEDLFPAHTTPSSISTSNHHNRHHQKNENPFCFPSCNSNDDLSGDGVATTKTDDANTNGEAEGLNSKRRRTSLQLANNRNNNSKDDDNNNNMKNINDDDDDNNHSPNSLNRRNGDKNHNNNTRKFSKNNNGSSAVTPIFPAVSGSVRFEEGAREVLIFLKNSGALRDEFAALILEEEEKNEEEDEKNNKNDNGDDDDKKNNASSEHKNNKKPVEDEETKKKRIELVKNIAAIMERIETKKGRSYF